MGWKDRSYKLKGGMYGALIFLGIMIFIYPTLHFLFLIFYPCHGDLCELFSFIYVGFAFGILTGLVCIIGGLIFWGYYKERGTKILLKIIFLIFLFLLTISIVFAIKTALPNGKKAVKFCEETLSYSGSKQRGCFVGVIGGRTICKFGSEEFRILCYAANAGAYKKWSMCEEAKNEFTCDDPYGESYCYTKDCITFFMKDISDANLCKEIKDSEIQRDCFGIVTYNTKTPIMCEGFTEQKVKDNCYYSISTRTRFIEFMNVDICKKIIDETIRNNCYYNYGAFKNEPTACEYISEDKRRLECYWGAINTRTNLTQQDCDRYFPEGATQRIWCYNDIK